MLRYEKVFTIAVFATALVLVSALLYGIRQIDSLKNQDLLLRAQNISLQEQNNALQGNIVDLTVDVRSTRADKHRLVRKTRSLDNRLWVKTVALYSARWQIRCLVKGLVFWTSKYDKEVAQNVGHAYGRWPNNFSDILGVDLATIAMFGAEGELAAKWRLDELKQLILSQPFRWGWEEQLFRELKEKVQ